MRGQGDLREWEIVPNEAIQIGRALCTVGRSRKHAVDAEILLSLGATALYNQMCNLERFLSSLKAGLKRRVCVNRRDEAKRVIGRNTWLILLKNTPLVITAYCMKCTAFSVVPKVQEIEASGQGPGLWLQVQLAPHTTVA